MVRLHRRKYQPDLVEDSAYVRSEALSLMTRADALSGAETRARAYAAEAREALAAFPDSPLRQALEGVVEFVVARLN